MKTIRLNTKLSKDEKETHIIFDFGSNIVKMDSTIPRDFNKAIKGGWTPTEMYVNPDGSVAGYILKAPRSCISIRKVPTTKRKLTDEQKAARIAALNKWRESNKNT